jgi:hypothetical protein
MKCSALGRYLFSSCVATVVLAACGGSQPPTGAPGAATQTSAIAAHAGRGKSWMLHEATSDDLLYIAAWPPAVYVYTYPKGQLAGTLTRKQLKAAPLTHKRAT